MDVVGFRRTPRGDEPCRALPSAEFSDWLPRIDYLVLALPLSDESHHLIDANTLARMKPEAVVVNIARGGVLDEAALIDALERRAIRGAALDVFETEPLPESSPLWTLPNVVITPHSSGETAGNRGRACEIFLENLSHYTRGEPLRNEVTRSTAAAGASASGNSTVPE